MKKLLLFAIAALTLAACGESSAQERTAENFEGSVAVVSREEGSGSRDAFDEILNINSDEDNVMADGTIIQQGNGSVATFVAGNPYGIGYVSFQTMTSTEGLRGLAIEGVEPTHENVINGTFPIARPFEVIYDAAAITELEEAFLVFLQSAEGTAELAAQGTIPDDANAAPFDVAAFSHLSGLLSLGGSTSTERAVEAAAQKFTALLPNVDFTYVAAGSGAGIRGAQDGTYSLGFASRAVGADELSATANSFIFTMDGIAVVVNEENPLPGLTMEQLRDMFLGEVTDWSEVR